jgi:hypothetical protein
MGKKRKKMRATVEKIIKPVNPREPEKAQITIPVHWIQGPMHNSKLRVACPP